MRITKPLHVILKQTTAATLRRLTTTTLALALVVGGSLAYQNLSKQPDAAQAANALMTFSEYATHPYASKAGIVNSTYCKDFCPVGRTIFDMEVTSDGKLIAGYGDWTNDTDSLGVPEGRVGVVPLDLSNGTWGDMYYSGSEAMDVIRKINGHLYIPTTDPSHKQAHGETKSGAGYLTNDTGEWRFVRTASAVHYLDMTSSDGKDIWIVGSRDIGGGKGEAIARRSVDGGQTFETVQADGSVPVSAGNGYERYYWTAALNGKVYMQARGINPVPPTRVFDSKTSQWSNLDGNGIQCGDDGSSTAKASRATTFDNHIVCAPNTSQLVAYDGITSLTVGVPGMYGVYDLYQTPTHLYVLGSTGIFRTTSLSQPWEQVSRISKIGSSSARSLAVHDSYVYLGTSDSKIYKSNIKLDTPAEPVNLENCLQFDATTKTIIGYNMFESNNYTTGQECPKDIVIPASIDGVAVETIGSEALMNKGLTSVTIPSSVTTIASYAFNYNSLSSVTILGNASIDSSAFGSNSITTLNINTQIIPANTFNNKKITNLTLGQTVKID